MAYDAATGQAVLFGGYGGSSNLADTWTYQVGAAGTPSSAVGTPAPQTPVYFTIGTAGTLPALSNANVLTSGASGLDFTLGTGSTCTGAVTAGQNCTVNVAFTPTTPGQRLGAVNLLSSTGTVLAMAYISGTGTGPQVTFSPGAISTAAGNGSAGYTASQDTGTTAATAASLYYPQGVALDGAGNLYIADTFNYRIRKVTAATGDISTVAGNGTYGYTASQDNGTTVATAASLSGPRGVAVDGAGNLYIADTSNQRIRKVTATTGYISTVAGNGTAGYISSQDNGTVAATATSLNSPYGIALDGAGNLYIADYSNSRIREVTAANGNISTVAGNGTAGYNYSQDSGNTAATATSINAPYGVTLDGAGNLYIADFGNSRIRKVTAATGNISTVAGNGTPGYTASQDTGNTPATSASLNGPSSVVMDGAGNLYIGDQNNSRIRKVTAATGDISTVAGNGTSGYTASQDNGNTAATATALNDPYGVAVDSVGNLYFADQVNHRIRKVTATAAPLIFPDTAVNGASATQTVMLNNIGNTALSFPRPFSGQNPSQSLYFAQSNSSTCPLVYSSSSAGTLASGATCTEILSYSPTVSGSVTGNLIFTDNSLNAAGSTQTVIETGSTLSTLTVSVIGQTVPQGTSSITLEFTVGYGGNIAPTAVPSLTVNGSSTNVGTVACTAKSGHLNCTAIYNPSSLAPGLYTITATQPADSNYSATSAADTLTITKVNSGPVRVGPIATAPIAKHQS